MKETIRIGTRGSALAKRQTELVVAELKAAHPKLRIETLVLSTSGDRFQGNIGPGLSTKGLFTKELEEALLATEIDLAVHSMKDMPVESPAGLTIACVPKRADPRDAILGSTWENLRQGAKVGTGSPRRSAQFLHKRPDLEMVAMRGNVDTRIRKREEEKLDAIILACAGLDRLGLSKEISQRLDFSISLPAPGQGALALQTREKDLEIAGLLAQLHDEATFLAVQAEREMMKIFAAGCSVPLAAFAQVNGDRLRLEALVSSPDGKKLIRDQEEGQKSDSAIAKRLAERLLRQGAKEILQ